MNTTRYLHQKKEYNKCQFIEAHYIFKQLTQAFCSLYGIRGHYAPIHTGTSTFTKVRSDDSRGGKFMFPT